MTAEGDEIIRLVPATKTGWLGSYEASLASSGLGSTSRDVVIEDSIFISDRSVLGVGDTRWGPSRIRTGAVMGAVQSGKTASMIGVAARSLDNGVNVVVVLAGTQVSLWQQSLGRLRAQLDSGPNPMMRRVFLPNIAEEETTRRAGPAEAYGITPGQASRAFKRGRPLVVVAMKQVDHLLHLGQTLHSVVYPAAEAAGVPVHLLVIDDEADDSSVADDGAQWGSPDLDVYKQVPRRIVDLWESRNQPGSTVSKNVYATYLAYTATPQANFLQDPQNPLAPRSFVASLRTPGPDGATTPRTLTYRVPEGLQGWYTGSDIYYGDLATTFCLTQASFEGATGDSVADPPPEPLDVTGLIDATRAYLVAAAVRLHRANGRVGPNTSRTLLLGSAAAVAGQIAPVSSMLIHPSSAMESHFEVARALRAWWKGNETAGGIEEDLIANEPAWSRWVDAYSASATAVSAAFDHPGVPAGDRSIPAWTDVRKLLLDEIIPATTIAVVNSDPNADERPSFEPWQEDDGWHAPRNHSTIFVAGNVMSRGLTLEGLLTTLFTRSSASPLADTQMQMQRWFGYRGAYIDLCRVFLSAEQLSLFTQYADADHALRSQVLASMEEEPDGLPDFTVLQGQAFQATGKVSGLVGRQLRPGSRPFVRHLNPVGSDEPNLDLVASHFLEANNRERLATSRRGLLALDELSLVETAELLDRLRYVNHGKVQFEADRWQALGRQASLQDGDREHPLYRAPELETDGVDLGARSPFVIAAYLRFWAACLDRQVRGVLTDDQPPQRWSLLNLDAKRASQPTFRVGVRFGEGPAVTAGPFSDLAAATGMEIRSMDRAVEGNSLAAEWGSRKATDAGFAGDDLFDLSFVGNDLRLDADGTRAEGSPGLLLFHLVERHDENGGIALGLSIPAGGPDHVEAVSTARRRSSSARN